MAVDRGRAWAASAGVVTGSSLEWSGRDAGRRGKVRSIAEGMVAEKASSISMSARAQTVVASNIRHPVIRAIDSQAGLGGRTASTVVAAASCKRSAPTWPRTSAALCDAAKADIKRWYSAQKRWSRRGPAGCNCWREATSKTRRAVSDQRLLRRPAWDRRGHPAAAAGLQAGCAGRLIWSTQSLLCHRRGSAVAGHRDTSVKRSDNQYRSECPADHRGHPALTMPEGEGGSRQEHFQHVEAGHHVAV